MTDFDVTGRRARTVRVVPGGRDFDRRNGRGQAGGAGTACRVVAASGAGLGMALVAGITAVVTGGMARSAVLHIAVLHIALLHAAVLHSGIGG